MLQRMYGLCSTLKSSSVRLSVAMRQQVLCHCNFLEPGSVRASTLRHPSLVVIFNVIEDKIFLSMLGSLCEAAVIQAFFCKPSTE